MDGYVTLAPHRLNQIVKTLTIVTTVFVPLGFVAGVRKGWMGEHRGRGARHGLGGTRVGG
jgi:hypothetical protein